MSRIIIIGCPGSGKSTLTAKIQDVLKYPVLHLDKIYHIDNNTHITREELIQKVAEFANSHTNWIIDGNYISTIEQRMILSDTVILLDIDTKTCIENAIARSKKEKQPDMATGFDISKLNQDFVNSIVRFKEDSLPKILTLFEKYNETKNIIILKSYEEIDKFIEKLRK